jgi:glycerol-3-phosphate dehydrogenase (NAD(P)+)
MNMIAEGYYATESVHKLCEDLKVNLPIIDAVYSVIYGGKQARPVFSNLAAGIS